MKADIAGRDPFRELTELFDNWRFAAPYNRTESSRASSWTPPCDVREDANEITVVAEIPGVKMEDIDLQVTADALTIKGERKFEQSDTSPWVRVERAYGTYSRSFSISVPINIAGVKASYRDGILTVSLPKAEDVKPKRIDVSAG